jgi:hypothetical protein
MITKTPKTKTIKYLFTATNKTPNEDAKHRSSRPQVSDLAPPSSHWRKAAQVENEAMDATETCKVVDTVDGKSKRWSIDQGHYYLFGPQEPGEKGGKLQKPPSNANTTNR